MVKEAGLSTDDVILSVNSVRRKRREAREVASERILGEVKDLADDEVVHLSWDEKKMENLVKESVNLKPEKKKEEMLAIVLSCAKFPEGKTIAIVPMEEGKGKGEDVADRIKDEIVKAELEKLNYGSLGFDTSSKNTGVKKGAAILLQLNWLKKEILYLACRHHILELVLAAVWELLFGKTKSSEETLCNKIQKE